MLGLKVLRQLCICMGAIYGRDNSAQIYFARKRISLRNSKPRVLYWIATKIISN